MLFSLVYAIVRALLRLLPARGIERSLEIELLVLRHELKILRRRVARPKLRRRDRLFLAAASRILPRERWRAFVVTPRTLLRWHRELIRRKWTYRPGRRGWPPLDAETVELIIRLARENPRWGYMRIRGELPKLSIRVSATSIRTVLRREGLGPAPRRSGPSWREFLRAQARGILALDFFTVERAWLRTLYALFAIELGSRRVHVLGVTTNPDSAWGTQQARNLAVGERLREIRFVIRDRDSKFSGPFDEVFRTEGVRVVKTPIRAPKANAFAERWVGSARRECLDHILILGRRHLDRVLREFADHYNAERPHRGLRLARPSPATSSISLATGAVRRRDRLGGVIHEYHREAA
ncbi:MAG: integrase core domain-containing protein [Actinomycetota bacterium]